MIRIPFILLLLLLFTSCSEPSRPVLRIFTWSEFFAPDLITEFEKKHDCRVIVDVYDSNESMYAKLKLGTPGYDLIFPSNYFLDILIQQGMIQKLKIDQIPNARLLDQDYINPEYMDWSLPFIVSYTAIAYRKDRIATLEPSWTVFSKPEFRGRMTMLNDIRETLGTALKVLGYSINTTNPEEVNQAGDLIIEWKQNLAKFENDQYKNGITNAEFLVVHTYSMDYMQVYQENKNIALLFPKEGSILSIDYMAIPANAPSPSLARTFINYLYEPEVAAKNMEHTNALIPVKGSYSLLPLHLKNSPTLFPPKKEKQNMELIKDLGKDAQIYYDVWDRVKGT